MPVFSCIYIYSWYALFQYLTSTVNGELEKKMDVLFTVCRLHSTKRPVYTKIAFQINSIYHQVMLSKTTDMKLFLSTNKFKLNKIMRII